MTQKKTHTLSLLAALTSAVIFGMSFMFSRAGLCITGKRKVLLVCDSADDADHQKKTGQSCQHNIRTHASAPPFLLNS